MCTESVCFFNPKYVACVEHMKHAHKTQGWYISKVCTHAHTHARTGKDVTNMIEKALSQ